MKPNDIINAGFFKKACDFCFSSNDGGEIRLNNCNPGSIVFCKIDHVFSFFERIRLTRKRIVLVTGEGDLSCGTGHYQYLPANINRWFATNVTHPHERVTALPLGLGPSIDPGTLSFEQIDMITQEEIPRNQWLYVNFRPQTNPSVRQPIFDHFKILGDKQPWITFHRADMAVGHELYVHNLMSHRFVLCPPGNGIDTHRMWEALATGCIPVVLRSQAMIPFENLRILMVENYRDVTIHLLQETWERMKSTNTSHSMLLSQFWAEKILSSKNELRGHEIMTWKEWIGESIKYGAGMMLRRLGINV